MNTNIAGDTKRHPILDTTGTVRKWLTTGRGVAVWTSHDIGAGRADVLTPADHVCEQLLTCASVNAVPLCRKPHWAYMPERALLTVDDALFYLPGQIVKSWTDGPAGYKAACRALAKYPDETREAPIGTVYTTYTLHRYAMVSAQISPDGTVLDTYGAPLAPDATGHAIPTDVEHRIGIRMWNAIDHAPATGNAK